MALNNSIRTMLFPHRQPKPVFQPQMTDAPDSFAPEHIESRLHPQIEQPEIEQPMEQPTEQPAPMQKRASMDAPTVEMQDFSDLVKPKKTGMDAAQENVDNILAGGEKKHSKLQKILFAALQGANAFFNPQQAQPYEGLDTFLYKKKLANAQGKLKPYQQQAESQRKAEESALKVKKLNEETTGVQLKNQSQKISNQTDLVKTLLDSIKADDVVTPDEAAYFRQKSGMDITDYNASKMKETTVNGVPFQRPELGNQPYAPNQSLPISQRDLEIKQKVGNFEGVTTSEQGLKNAIQNDNNNVNRQMRAGEFQTNIGIKKEEMQQKAAKEQSDDADKRAGNYSKAEADLAEANAALAKLDPQYDSTKIAEYEGKAAAAKKLMEANQPKAQELPKANPNGGKRRNRGKGKSANKPKSDPLGLFN